MPSEGGKLGSAAPSSNTKNESLAVQMLTKQVEQIKEALGREQQQLKVAQGRASHDDGAGVEVMMLSAAVNTTSGQLTNASAQLVAAILAESDASKGALLDVVA